jgi:hypothetical protein
LLHQFSNAAVNFKTQIYFSFYNSPGKFNWAVSISGCPRCRDGTKLPWQSLPPLTHSWWRAQ